jgi:hypothetical protein
MGKMPHADWKQWTTRQQVWIREEIEDAFERFIEQKWSMPQCGYCGAILLGGGQHRKADKTAQERPAGVPKKAGNNSCWVVRSRTHHPNASY